MTELRLSMKKILILFALIATVQDQVVAQTTVQQTITARLETPVTSLQSRTKQDLDIIIDGLFPNAVVNATLVMPSMAGMMLEAPVVTKSSLPKHYTVTCIFPHPGAYELRLTVEQGGTKSTLSIPLEIGNSMTQENDHSAMQMQGTLGRWSMNREGSGTAWQPDSSPMFMKMLPSSSGWGLSTMGNLQAGYVSAGGSRGDKAFFTDSMLMLMGRKEVGNDILGFGLMTSLDPIINGVKGVPDLFQTGETAHGAPLVDRQHPHNLYAELSGSYSKQFSNKWSAFVYGGPFAEPALGNVMFMHRASDMEVPEAPISHHWFDSTHISFGVLTLGATYQNKWKLDGS